MFEANQDMLVSVTIPAYNAGRFVSSAIESVLSQSHQEIELIVVDDGSSDDTAEVVQTFDDPRLTLLRVSHGGVCRARNVGLELARGDFIAFLDADDWWYPDKLSTQLTVLDQNPQVVAVGSLMRYESMKGRALGISGQDVTSDDRDLIAQGRLMPFTLSSTLFRTAAVRQLGGFDDELPGLAHDLDLIARLAAQGTLGCVPSVLGVYRVHEGSLSARDRRLRRMATRFVRQRISARSRGDELTWEQFSSSYRLNWSQRYGDMVQVLYRASGERAAEQRWPAAIGLGLAALLMGPRYTVRRLLQQQRPHVLGRIGRGRKRTRRDG